MQRPWGESMAGVLKETWWEWHELGKSRGRKVRGNGRGVQSPVHRRTVALSVREVGNHGRLSSTDMN